MRFNILKLPILLLTVAAAFLVVIKAWTVLPVLGISAALLVIVVLSKSSNLPQKLIELLTVTLFFVSVACILASAVIRRDGDSFRSLILTVYGLTVLCRIVPFCCQLRIPGSSAVTSALNLISLVFLIPSALYSTTVLIAEGSTWSAILSVAIVGVLFFSNFLYQEIAFELVMFQGYIREVLY